MSQVRKFTGLALLSSVAAVVVLWLALGCWAMWLGPSWFARQLHARFGVDAAIGAVRTDFFHSISLRDVKVSRPVEGSVREVRFSFRPWDLFSLRSRQRQLFLVVLSEPHLSADLATFSNGSPKERSGPLRIFPFRAAVEGGTIELRNGLGRTWTFTDLNGDARLTPFRLEIDADGNLNHWGVLNARLRAATQTPHQWELRVNSDRLNAGGALTFATERFRAKAGAIAGDVKLNSLLRGALVKRLQISFWQVGATAIDVSWMPPGATTAVPVSGSAGFFKDHLQFDRLRVDRTTVNGTVGAPWNAPRLGLKIAADRQELGPLAHAYLPSGLSFLGGTVSGRGELQGTPANPRASFEANGDVRLGAIRLPPASGTFSLNDGAFLGGVDVASGKLQVHGTNLGAAPRWSLEAQRLSLADLAAANAWISVAGVADARFIVDPANGAASGSLSLDNVHWGRFRTRGRHDVAFRYAAGNITATADNGAMALTARNTPDRFSVSDLRFSAGGGTMTVAGLFDRRSSRLDFSLKGDSVPVELWPPLVDRYPDVDGRVDLSGTLGGAVSAPEVNLAVTVPRIRFRRDGSDYRGRAVVASVGRRIQVKDIRADESVTGAADIDLSTRRWQVSARLDDTSPAFLADLAKIDRPTSGSISGFVDASGGDRLVARSSFTWSTGHADTYYFDELSASAALDGNHLTLEQVSLVRGTQALRGRADLHRHGDEWSGEGLAQAQRWEIGRVPIDGEISAQGEFSLARKTYSAVLTTPVLFVANRNLESVSATLAGSPDGLTLDGAAGEDRVRLSATVDRNRLIKGRLTAKDLALEELFRKPESGVADARPTGQYDVDATLSGSVAAPAAMIHAVVRNAAWRHETFAAEGTVAVSTAAARLEDLSADFPDGGRLAATGTFDFGKGHFFRLDGAGSDVGLQSVFNLLGWPVTWAGRTDGSFSVTRATDGYLADIRFDGEHDGFGPFREGGDLAGRVVGNGREWSLLGIKIESGDGYLQVSDRSRIYIDRNGTGTFRLLADVRNLQAGPLTLFGGVETAGRWRAGEGDQERRIDLDVFARELYVNQFSLDGNVTHMAIVGRKIDFSPIPGSGQQISGTLAYDAYPDLIVDRLRFIDNGIEKILLSGNVGIRNWDFRLATHALDADVVRGLFDFGPEMSGAMDVDITATGTPARPDIHGTVVWTKGRFGPLPLDRAEARLGYTHNSLVFSDVTVERRRGYVAQGNARFGHGEEGDKVPMEVNLRIDRGDATLLQDMFPEDVSRARGTFDARLRIGGSAGNAAISGFLNAHKISVTSSYTPDLDRGELRLRIERNVLTVDRATARLGAGELAGGGRVEFRNGAPSRYDLQLQTVGGTGATLRAPQLDIAPGPVLGKLALFKKKLAGASRGDPVIDLTLKGPADGPTMAGLVRLENAVFTYPPSSHRSVMSSGWLHAFVNRLNWDLRLVAGKRTWYQNELVDAAVTGEIDFTGPTTDLAVNGRVYTEQGSIVYSGNEFQIKEAELDVETRRAALTNAGAQTNVYLRATAEREVFYTDALANSNQDVIVMAVDRSLIGEIQPRFYSKNNPGLSSQRALQLALGLPFGDNIDSNSLLPDQRARISERADNDKLLRLGMIQLLDSNLASPLARALARNTGLVDFIRVSYQEQDPHQPEGITSDATQTNVVTQNEFLKYAKGTKVKFGRGLGTRLFADYSFRVEEFESQLNLRHEVELAYRLHRNLFLRGTSELDRERELGRPPDRRAILENQWRFGLPRKRRTGPPSGAVPAPADKAG